MRHVYYYLIGSLFILSGTILLGFMHLAIAVYLPDLSSWSNPPGQVITVIGVIGGWFPYTLSIIQLVIGIILISVPLIKEGKKKQFIVSE
ncbi:hypothetical protein FLK61_40140 [Paenalkalicoccus suaedae]|uniref:Uncharacterized protein n=1 Tax=Paenalkalicoccus suaedae TaxID=2592382 RepID=A0A859FHK0_9BACI|nr:hypothetical protein [Paenalkalicoccus suaedae]QKS72823.1 hypothetical protein FLK61_40140 [Paenalkalicoccus suaedae]